MVILEYTKRVRDMFELAKLLSPPSSNNKEYHEAAWYNRYIPYKEDIILKVIK